MLKKGDPVTVIVAGRRVTGEVFLVSENQKSLFLIFDEGIPAPFCLVRPTPDMPVELRKYSGKQAMRLFREGDDGPYQDLDANRQVLIDQQTESQPHQTDSSHPPRTNQAQQPGAAWEGTSAFYDGPFSEN